MHADAQKLSNLGYALVPGTLDKKPKISWGQWRDRRQDRAEVADKEAPLWGIVTGQAHGIVVLDFDGPEGVALAKTLRLVPNVITGSGGWHVWLDASTIPFPVKTCAGVRPGLDVRGEGGLVWTAGRSRKGEYQLLSTALTPNAPPIINLLPERTEPTGGADFAVFEGEGDGTPGALRVLRSEADKVRRAAPGTSNAALNAAGFAVGGLIAAGELSDEVGHATLMQAAYERDCGEPDRVLSNAMAAGSGSPWTTNQVDEDDEYVPISDVKAWQPPPRVSGGVNLDAMTIPLDAFPPAVTRLVEASADIVNCPPEFIAASTLPALAQAAGGFVTMNLRDTWRWSPVFFTALVGSPGTAKSPAISLALAPVREAEKAEWINVEDGSPEHRYLVDDATTERLAEILGKNPRGLLLAVDELAAFFGGMDSYRAMPGRDRQFFLSVWSHEPITVDRISKGRSLHVPRPMLSILGGIQPEVFANISVTAEDGLMPRFLMVYSDPTPDCWVEDDIPAAALAGYSDLWNDVRDAFSQDAVLALTPEAKRAWRSWYDTFHAASPPPELAVSWKKVRSHMYRLSLLLACCDGAEVVTAEHIDRAWAIVQPMLGHTLFILRTAQVSSPDEKRHVKARSQLAEYIEDYEAEHGERPTRTRILQYGPAGTRRKRDLDAMLDELGVVL